MRMTPPLSIPLMLASSAWLAGCSPNAVPAPQDPAAQDQATTNGPSGTAGEGADPAAPPPMQGPAAPTPPDDTEAPTPHTRDAPFQPATPAVPATPPPTDTPPSEPAQGDARARIERVLGDAAAYETVFIALQQGVARGDRAAVAALMRYPLRVDVAGKQRQIRDAATFEREYDSIVTRNVARTIAAQSFDTVFANQQGVMIGNGQVWLNGICGDAACARSDVRVVSIQE